MSDHRDDGGGATSTKRGAFLGFVAHEVRNPLSTALWSAELLARLSAEERGGARGEKLVGMCLRSIGRVRQLVEDHFLCERLDAGGLALKLEPVGAGELTDTLRERSKDAGELALDLPDGLAVKADRLLLERALDALFGAASRDGAAVRIAAAEGDDGTVAFVVSGAPPLPDALRDPVKGSPSDQRGRALGLPVARRVAAALGGTLMVSPEGYTLSLPRAREYAAPPGPPANP